jgi:hypothetical protein
MPRESANSNVTSNHETIREWVEERGGHPARVKGTKKSGSIGVLRIDYPGYSGEETLEPITWEQFFEAFDSNNLAFLYQDETKDGKQSRFSKLIDRNSTEKSGRAAHS